MKSLVSYCDKVYEMVGQNIFLHIGDKFRGLSGFTYTVLDITEHNMTYVNEAAPTVIRVTAHKHEWNTVVKL